MLDVSEQRAAHAVELDHHVVPVAPASAHGAVAGEVGAEELADVSLRAPEHERRDPLVVGGLVPQVARTQPVVGPAETDKRAARAVGAVGMRKAHLVARRADDLEHLLIAVRDRRLVPGAAVTHHEPGETELFSRALRRMICAGCAHIGQLVAGDKVTGLDRSVRGEERMVRRCHHGTSRRRDEAKAVELPPAHERPPPAPAGPPRR